MRPDHVKGLGGWSPVITITKTSFLGKGELLWIEEKIVRWGQEDLSVGTIFICPLIDRA